jgi:hypothetical protein
MGELNYLRSLRSQQKKTGVVQNYFVVFSGIIDVAEHLGEFEVCENTSECKTMA